MSTTATVTVDNQLSNGLGSNPAFNLIAGSTALTAGVVTFGPVDVVSKSTVVPNNGGIYTSASSGNLVEGVVTYKIPGGRTFVVIYFSTQKAALIQVDATAQITTDTVTQGRAGTGTVTGTFAVDRELFDYQFEVKTQKSPDGKGLQAIVTATCTAKS